MWPRLQKQRACVSKQRIGVAKGLLVQLHYITCVVPTQCHLTQWLQQTGCPDPESLELVSDSVPSVSAGSIGISTSPSDSGSLSATSFSASLVLVHTFVQWPEAVACHCHCHPSQLPSQSWTDWPSLELAIAMTGTGPGPHGFQGSNLCVTPPVSLMICHSYTCLWCLYHWSCIGYPWEMVGFSWDSHSFPLVAMCFPLYSHHFPLIPNLSP